MHNYTYTDKWCNYNKKNTYRINSNLKLFKLYSSLILWTITAIVLLNMIVYFLNSFVNALTMYY